MDVFGRIIPAPSSYPSLSVVILWGDSDGRSPEAFAHAYYNLIPNSNREFFKGFSHIPMVEAQEAFMEKAAKA